LENKYGLVYIKSGSSSSRVVLDPLFIYCD